jgi:hypothetical protein
MLRLTSSDDIESINDVKGLLLPHFYGSRASGVVMIIYEKR